MSYESKYSNLQLKDCYFSIGPFSPSDVGDYGCEHQIMLTPKDYFDKKGLFDDQGYAEDAMIKNSYIKRICEGTWEFSCTKEEIRNMLVNIGAIEIF